MDQALTSPQKGHRGSPKTHGVMQWWSNGVLKIKKRMMFYRYFPSSIIRVKADLIPQNQ